MLDELLQKAVGLYVRPGEREAALITFRQLLTAAAAEGASKATDAISVALAKRGKS